MKPATKKKIHRVLADWGRFLACVALAPFALVFALFYLLAALIACLVAGISELQARHEKGAR